MQIFFIRKRLKSLNIGKWQQNSDDESRRPMMILDFYSFRGNFTLIFHCAVSPTGSFSHFPIISTMKNVSMYKSKQEWWREKKVKIRHEIWYLSATLKLFVFWKFRDIFLRCLHVFNERNLTPTNVFRKYRNLPRCFDTIDPKNLVSMKILINAYPNH